MISYLNSTSNHNTKVYKKDVEKVVSYLDSTSNHNNQGFSDAFRVEAYDTVGKAVIEKLNYREKKIKEAMILKRYHEKSTGTEAIQLIKNSFKENTWYADSFIKKELNRIFKLLGIKYPKSVTSHTIGDFFEYEDKPTSKQRGKVLHRCKF